MLAGSQVWFRISEAREDASARGDRLANALPAWMTPGPSVEARVQPLGGQSRTSTVVTGLRSARPPTEPLTVEVENDDVVLSLKAQYSKETKLATTPSEWDSIIKTRKLFFEVGVAPHYAP